MTLKEYLSQPCDMRRPKHAIDNLTGERIRFTGISQNDWDFIIACPVAGVEETAEAVKVYIDL